MTADEEFLALDVETANSDPGSICQLGLAVYRGGTLVSSWGRLVDCGQPIAPMNETVHGIRDSDLAGAVPLATLLKPLTGLLSGRIVAQHTAFDQRSIAAAYAACGMAEPEIRWLDTAAVARRTWEHVSKKGWGLADLCRMIGHENAKPHDAEHDAIACGAVMVAAIRETGLGAADWQDRLARGERSAFYVKGGGSVSVESRVTYDGNAAGRLFGEVVCITGKLSLERAAVATMANEVGCKVTASVSKKTTILVLGETDGVTGKAKKAKELAANGHPIRIMDERAFLALIDSAR